MNIFADLIKETNALLTSSSKSYHPIPVEKIKQAKGELILNKEKAYELGAPGFSSCAYMLFTEDSNEVYEDEIIVYGPDLNEIKNDTSFARIAIILTKDVDAAGEQATYAILENINLKNYNINPLGYMVRTSVLSNREQVRISKKCSQTFQSVGSLYINEFKKNKYVAAVKLIFVTAKNIDYLALEKQADLAIQVFRALNHAVNDLKMDCKHCDWKLLCDQVEGLKEAHQKILEKGGIKSEKCI